MLTQPIPTVTEQDVERVVLRQFPAEQAAEVHAILTEYGADGSERQPHRVRLAALKLAGGSVERLRNRIAAAKLDFRDVLALAEYPEYARSVSPSARLTPAERQRIIEADWRQYSEWLAE